MIYYALEGSHRITSAKELNLVPVPYIIAEIDMNEDDFYEIYLNAKSRLNKGLFVEF